MKKLIILILITLFGSRSFAVATYSDSSEQRPTVVTTNLDTLKQQLKLIINDSLKSALYLQMVAQYLKNDSAADKKTKLDDQNQALNYTYLALHLYSKYNDTTGLINCFNYLSKIYRSQEKYSQAKWFILQSNTLSRIKNDVPNILTSLIELANIKMDIKDYSLAMSDLNEALKLSTANHYPRVESHVQETYALLYSRLNDYTREAMAIKRHNFIDDSIRKSEKAVFMARIRERDSLQNKKKVYSPVSGKVYKPNYAARIALL